MSGFRPLRNYSSGREDVAVATNSQRERGQTESVRRMRFSCLSMAEFTFWFFQFCPKVLSRAYSSQ
jgi:hypothetical protein